MQRPSSFAASTPASAVGSSDLPSRSWSAACRNLESPTNGRRRMVIMLPFNGLGCEEVHPGLLSIACRTDRTTRSMSEITKSQQIRKSPKPRAFVRTLGRSWSPLKRHEWQFTDATEPHNPIIFANDSFLSLNTGTTGTRCSARASIFYWRMLLMAKRWRESRTSSRAQSEGGGIHYRRKDGSKFWTAVFISPFVARARRLSNILPPLLMSPNIKRTKPTRNCSSTS